MNKTRQSILKEIRPFILVTFLFSWTIFFVIDGWLIPHYANLHQYALAGYSALFGHALAMFGPGIGALVSWRFFRAGSPPAWKWGTKRVYILAFGILLFYWFLPGYFYTLFSKEYSFQYPSNNFHKTLILCGSSIYWLFGLGEETGWCGFLIPVLRERASTTNALIVSGAIRGIWHLPVLIAPLVYQVITHQKPFSRLIVMTLVYSVQLMLSNIAFGSFFYWIWIKTKSLPLAAWTHQWFDAFRDVSLILIVNYVNSAWFKLYSGLVMALAAGYVMMLIYRTDDEAASA
jgi:membrane protease YdiL (CAAX protease family)